MKSQLDSILEFANFIHKFRQVERRCLANGTDRHENDAEHSYSLALLAWYINSSHNLGLDTDKLLKYALAHDIVEVYAGDTYFFHTDQNVHAQKHLREEEAAKQIAQEFSEFPEMHQIMEEYEKRNDKESAFIYALDKIEPMLSIYLDGGRTWKQNEVTLEMLETMKGPKVASDPTIKKVFEELVEKLKVDHSTLFEK